MRYFCSAPGASAMPWPGRSGMRNCPSLAARHLLEQIGRHPVDELHQEPVAESAGHLQRQLVHDVRRDERRREPRPGGRSQRLAEAVGPAHVGHQVARGPPLDQLAELEARVVVLAGRHGNLDGVGHLRAGGDVVGQHRLLVPDEIELLEQRRLTDVAEHVELLVDVDHHAHAGAEGLLARPRHARGSPAGRGRGSSSCSSGSPWPA